MEYNADLMTPNPYTVRVHTPVLTCARRMLRHRIRHLIVVDEDRRPFGVVTDFAVFQLGFFVDADQETWLPADPEAEHQCARDILEPIDTVVYPHDAVMPTLQRIVRSRQDFAAVIDESGKLCGVITEHDGVRVAAITLPESSLKVGAESHAPVYCATPEDHAQDVLAEMVFRRIRHVVILDEDGRAIGVLSYADLVAADAANQPHLYVANVLRKGKLRHISADSPLSKAAIDMLTFRIGCLPVLDKDRRPIGIVTRSDLIEAAVVVLEERAMFEPTELAPPGSFTVREEEEV